MYECGAWALCGSGQSRLTCKPTGACHCWGMKGGEGAGAGALAMVRAKLLLAVAAACGPCCRPPATPKHFETGACLHGLLTTSALPCLPRLLQGPPQWQTR